MKVEILTLQFVEKTLGCDFLAKNFDVLADNNFLLSAQRKLLSAQTRSLADNKNLLSAKSFLSA